MLYHNPRCSKSRAALALLEERGVPVRIVRSLEEPLSRAALADLAAKLGLPARSFGLRTGEASYAAAGLGPATPDANDRRDRSGADPARAADRGARVEGGGGAPARAGARAIIDPNEIPVPSGPIGRERLHRSRRSRTPS